MRIACVRLTVGRVLGPALIVLVTACVVGAVVQRSPAQAKPPEHLSLMQTISEWSYPGARPLAGASMSDGGNPLVQDVKCQAVLTTRAPIEKVVAFYAKKLGTDPVADRQEPGAKDEDARSVAAQDDSEGRPVRVCVFVVNRQESATTLAISRGRDEKETHIGWLHYMRLDGGR